MVSIKRDAQVKRIAADLPELVARLESGHLVWPRFGKAPSEFKELGVRNAWPSSDDGGVIYLLSEGWAGWEGRELTPWLDQMFERHPDVPAKLAAHPASAGHAFLWVTASTDFSVQSCLEDRGQPLPSETPTLPEGVTHLWVASSMSSQGVLAWFPDRGWWRTPWEWSSEPPQIPAGF
jgi:hypothetical protein